MVPYGPLGQTLRHPGLASVALHRLAWPGLASLHLLPYCPCSRCTSHTTCSVFSPASGLLLASYLFLEFPPAPLCLEKSHFFKAQPGSLSGRHLLQESLPLRAGSKAVPAGSYSPTHLPLIDAGLLDRAHPEAGGLGAGLQTQAQAQAQGAGP